MKTELILKLQSWVDGELPEQEALQVAQWASTDPEAAALVRELKMTRQVLVDNEPEARLEEPRAFYWSQIQRAIERAEAVESAPERLPWKVALRRLLVPVGGFALIVLAAGLTILLLNREPSNDPGQLVEVENLSDGVDSMSYKSQSENMFVVYVFNKDSGPSEEEKDLDWDLEDDSVIQ